MTPYVSIDIETTGLNPQTCQVLEIGAVIDNGGPVEALPKFRAVLKHDSFRGEAYAFSMHPTLLREIALVKVPKSYCVENDLSTAACIMRPDQVVERFINFLTFYGVPTDKGFTPAGQNYASFDKAFLEQCVPRWKSDVKIKHRTIDTGNLFWRKDDEYLPDTQECYRRAGLPVHVAHTAIEDAVGVVKLIRAYWAAQLPKSGAEFAQALGYITAALHPTLVIDANNPLQMARDIVAHVNAAGRCD